MSFNRLIYDSCEYIHRLHEQTSPLSYQLNPLFHESTKKCLNDYPGFLGSMGGMGFGVGAREIDIDSELRNQFRIASRCPEEKYIPNCDCGNCSRSSSCNNYSNGLPCNCTECRNTNALAGCTDMFVEQNLRTKGGCNTLREIGIDRFDYLCENPQDLDKVVFYRNTNRRLGDETRLNAKNYHRRCGNTSVNDYKQCRAGGMSCRNNGQFGLNIYNRKTR